MSKFLAGVLITLLASCAHAQPRDTWIRKCQAEGPDLTNSNGYRVCTEFYVMEFEKQQKKLTAEVIAMLSREAEVDQEPPLARDHFVRSQEFWRSYAEEHCQVAQAMFSAGNPSGDAIPSCMAGEFEARNRQLRRMLEGQYER